MRLPPTPTCMRSFRQLDLPAWSALKQAGTPSTLLNQWRSMHHRLRRRLDREGMVPKKRPGRPPKNPPMQTFPNYGGNKVGSPPLPFSSENTERGASVSPAAAATPQAIGSKAESQAKGESQSETPDEGERSPKRARTEDKTEDEQPPKAFSARMQL